jgi:endonuclease/exonuclease/phosphatase family metal-dependent hydrolase
MRIASFNVENLFDRPKVMDQNSWTIGRQILQDFAALNQLLGQRTYSPADKAQMIELLRDLGLENSDESQFVILRSNRGKLVRRPSEGGLVIEANGRADWTGSLELIEGPVNEESMQNTARVINDVGADVLAVVEAENRPALAMFCDDVLPMVTGDNAIGAAWDQVMLIDGNDDRGIDVGLLTRNGCTIGTMRSHVDDRDGQGRRIFSRDCPEFTVTTPLGNEVLVLVNHFKSKGYGAPSESDRRRRSQALRVAEIYAERRAQGHDNIVVLGDLNDFPGRAPLKPLLADTDLLDIAQLPGFDDGGYPGTYSPCKDPDDKIDFILLSPALRALVRGGGVFRKGMWPGRENRWPAYPSITRPALAASDHAAIWADIDI